MRENGKPLVTIAIPTYNRADTYLPQAVLSAVNQTYANIEILISDNCSTDNTEAVVKDFKDSRIQYVKHSKNIGPFHNANFCVKEACGDYFVMLQDDDLLDPDMVETCLKSVNYTYKDIGIIRTGTRWIGPDGSLLREIPNTAGGLSLDDFFRAFSLFRTGIYFCSTVFNTKKLQEMGGFHSKHQLFYDVMASVKLAARYGREDIYDIKASNRKHDMEWIWSASVLSWCEDSLDLIQLMQDLAPENKDLVKAEGMRGLCAFNYNLAGKVASPMKRIKAYWVVYQSFDYVYSPYRLFYKKTIGSLIRAVKRKIKQMLLAT